MEISRNEFSTEGFRPEELYLYNDLIKVEEIIEPATPENSDSDSNVITLLEEEKDSSTELAEIQKITDFLFKVTELAVYIISEELRERIKTFINKYYELNTEFLFDEQENLVNRALQNLEGKMVGDAPVADCRKEFLHNKSAVSEIVDISKVRERTPLAIQLMLENEFLHDHLNGNVGERVLQEKFIASQIDSVRNELHPIDENIEHLFDILSKSPFMWNEYDFQMFFYLKIHFLVCNDCFESIKNTLLKLAEENKVDAAEFMARFEVFIPRKTDSDVER